MQFSIIHIISNLDRVNFGIWNAAIAASSFLHEAYGVESQVWVCDNKHDSDITLDIPVRHLGSQSTETTATELASKQNLLGNSLIVSHGCWLKPTRIAFRLKQMGLPWLYVPHGMLEPWSMGQGRLKKEIYYRLVEKRLATDADAIRAVSRQEQENLRKRFNQRIQLIENGVAAPVYSPKGNAPETFLFLGRLHHKKGILHLVKAWKNVMKGANKRLIIAGPDEGELEKILPFLDDSIKYVGPIYGDEKTTLMKKAHYFMLPSYSEGFPTSVVEAMGFGLIPMISRGCNFPEVFSASLGINIEPDVASIEAGLRYFRDVKFDLKLSIRNYDFIRQNYSMECIGEKLYLMYSEVLKRHKSLTHGSVLYK